MVGFVVLVLLAVLGYGVWLILNASDQNEPGRISTTTAAASTTSVSPSRSPSAAPSTEQPRTTQPAQVAVPPLAGSSLTAARRALSALGLGAEVVLESSAEVPAGRVLRTDPAAGTSVPRGRTVTLVIATRPTPTATQPPSTQPTSRPTASIRPTAG